MKNILMILLAVLFFGTTSHAAKYFCSMPEIRFNDAQGVPLFRGILKISTSSNVPFNSYEQYLSLNDRYCVGRDCSISYSRDLEPIAIHKSTKSYSDCLDRLLRPAEAVSRACRKEYFTAANLMSARSFPKIGQIKVLFGRSPGDLRNNPQVLQAPVDCQYF